MKSLQLTLFILGAVVLGGAASSKSRFLGEISDTQCAMNVHALNRSHQEMIKKNTLGTDAASCARACVKRGGEWVLRSTDDVYHLKNQPGMEQYAGQKVVVTGTLDPKTNTIDNIAIAPAPTTGGKPHQD